MKKILALVLALVMVLSLAACNTGSSKNGEHVTLRSGSTEAT